MMCKYCVTKNTTNTDRQHANCISTLTNHTSWVLSVNFSPTGLQFASASSDKKVKIWDFKNRQCVHTFESHTDQVWGLAYNDDGSKLASVSEDRSLAIYSTT